MRNYKKGITVSNGNTLNIFAQIGGTGTLTATAYGTSVPIMSGTMIISAAIGGLLGDVIAFDTQGLDFVMTAMFVVIFLEQFLNEDKHITGIIGFSTSIMCLLFFGKESFLIPTMLSIVISLTFFKKYIE